MIIFLTFYWTMKTVETLSPPSVFLRGPSLGHALDEDPQLLQALVGSNTHAYDADAQPVLP
jgi:hypothetical protein